MGQTWRTYKQRCGTLCVPSGFPQTENFTLTDLAKLGSSNDGADKIKQESVLEIIPEDGAFYVPYGYVAFPIKMDPDEQGLTDLSVLPLLSAQLAHRVDKDLRIPIRNMNISFITDVKKQEMWRHHFDTFSKFDEVVHK